ncbi:DoxX family protein [Streptomyces flavidovirens]|uniref:DoxX family protein n=1 Tax=Streptomyces flavidovirens TaxID=67298 RepID=UPI000413CE1B|nr:DoxX family protein [Streptomyces flavidovirens]
MFITYAVVTGVAIAVNAAEAVTNFLRSRAVLANSAEVGVPPSWLPVLGALKGAGAVGLLLGLLGVPFIGTAAAAGLVLFFIGAVVAHVRARVFHNIAFPASFLALAAASLLLAVAR